MHRLATVHARDNQPTNQPTNDQRRHDTAYLNKRLKISAEARHKLADELRRLFWLLKDIV